MSAVPKREQSSGYEHHFTQLDRELYLMKSCGLRTDTGTQTTESRKQAIRAALLERRSTAMPIVKARRGRITPAQAFERTYGEPLIERQLEVA